MNLVDANVLLYAVNTDAEHHRAARTWLDRAVAGTTTLAWAWPVLLAFVRIATRPGIFPRPLPVEAALQVVRACLEAPSAIVVHPTVQHLDVLATQLAEAGSGGNLVSDAHLAALAIEHRATVVTFDRDFERFGVRTYRPTAP
ncbi:type II toxin-antitoxin system VapC family toxin [Nitriliruptoraceae bacterium ZYF776]|nr:type II toxin-antitoxin system VapC family toxin [Profundirhabdus halotolerans]